MYRSYMKYTNGLLSCALVGSIFIAATQADAQTQEYRGRACVISANSHCNATGPHVGDCYLFRFLPPNALGNGDNTRLSLFDQTYALNYRQEGSAIGGTYKPMTFSAVGRSGGTFTTASRWRIPVVQPSNYAAAYVHFVVDIFRFNDYTGASESQCTVRLRAAGTKIPDQAPSSVGVLERLPRLEDGLGK